MTSFEPSLQQFEAIEVWGQSSNSGARHPVRIQELNVLNLAQMSSKSAKWQIAILCIIYIYHKMAILLISTIWAHFPNQGMLKRAEFIPEMVQRKL